MNTRPLDDYDRAYAEKLWQWIPEVYRTEDLGSAANGTLRDLIEAFAKEAAGERRAIDRLWDNMLIPFADDWAVEHIGSLLATRMLSPQNRRGRRIDVAKTLTYRRSAGTVWLLEELVHDITGWHGALMEGFASLARHPHNYDPEATYSSGRASQTSGRGKTPRAGRANLRASENAELVDGAFDPFYHRPDLRAPVTRAGGPMASSRGRHDIGRVNLHIYRQKSYRIVDSTPYRLDSKNYGLDPSGRAIPLFKEGLRPFSRPEITSNLDRSAIERWDAPQRWQIPMPMKCREFNSASYSPPLTALPDPNAYAPMQDVVYETLESLRCDYDRLRVGAPNLSEWIKFIEDSLVAGSPKSSLYASDASLFLGIGEIDSDNAPLQVPEIQAVSFEGQSIPSGFSGGFFDEVILHFDPKTGRIRLGPRAQASEACFVYRYHYGAFADIGAGPYPRPMQAGTPRPNIPEAWRTAEHYIAADGPSLASQIEAATEPLSFVADGNRTTRLSVPNDTIIVRRDLHLTAEANHRPYLRLEPTNKGFTFKGAAKGDDAPPCLVLDGLWLGLRPVTPPEGPNNKPTISMLTEALPNEQETWTIGLEGEFDQVILRNVTLDPGGEALPTDSSISRHIPSVKLLISGFVSDLRIENSICGNIVEQAIATPGEPADPCSVATVTISDSIIQSLDNSTAAIDVPNGSVSLVRSTVLGDTVCKRLSASDCLFDGTVDVSDLTNSCMRFSAAASSDEWAHRNAPRPYESHFLGHGSLPQGVFVSKSFGDPGFAQLSVDAPTVLLRGAENTSEMGAFNRQMSAILLEDLRNKIDEFRPIQSIPNFILET